MADIPPSTTVDVALSVEPHRFAIVPEWLLDSPVSDAAVRLYAVLARYGGSSGQRMPSRSTLAARLGKKSVDTVDRALHELESVGAVEVERRMERGQRLTNRYHLRTSDPAAGVVDRGRTVDDGLAASRTDAARVAAPMRHDPEVLTERETSPSLPSPRARRIPAAATKEAEVAAGDQSRLRRELLGGCGIDDLDAFARQLTATRKSLGKPVGRWGTHCLYAAIGLALQRGWPAHQVKRSLVAVASDPDTLSPMRLAEAGPWWDEPNSTHPGGPADEAELAELEAQLDALDGARVHLQRQAREQLYSEGIALTRTTVLRRAAALRNNADQR